MAMIEAFYAYPSDPKILGDTIESAVKQASSKFALSGVYTWRSADVAGAFVSDRILEAINAKQYFVADVSRLNFNVTFEVGYAIGRSKNLLLTRYRALDSEKDLLELGIFDTITYTNYENSDELAGLLNGITARSSVFPVAVKQNRQAPVYLVDAKYKTDPVTRIVARVKKARLFFRSFDPNEQPRLSAIEAIDNVAQSFGVLVPLLPSNVLDSRIHNLRAAFVAGVALGLGRVLCFLQDGNDPVPIDYRDLVQTFTHPTQIDDYIGDFATEVTEALQTGTVVPSAGTATLLEQLELGASSAENELRSLSEYYLETDAFMRALRGEVRLVVGRKGSGKTAIFLQVRDTVRPEKKNVVLDLKPDGYKLRKFKDVVFTLLSQGAQEHTMAAFWEYLLLLEICHKLIESDKQLHIKDHTLYEIYRKLHDEYETDDYVSEGDFSERMSKLLSSIEQNFRAEYGTGGDSLLSQAKLTELLYVHDVARLRGLIMEYLAHKQKVIVLIDNLDKGWPTHGLRAEDIVMLRTLIDAARKIERELDQREIECNFVIFLRNDVYELLVAETPDRGKEAKAIVDWTDGDMLREMLRLRFVYSGMSSSGSFEDIWRTIAVSHIHGEESSQYLIDRSLMRPRNLINLLSQCRGFAVNLKHVRIEVSDIDKGVLAYSADMVNEIGLEMRDVFPSAENLLYEFIGSDQRLPEDRMNELIKKAGVPDADREAVTRLLLWYGVIGVLRESGDAAYIYSANYDMNLLQGIARKHASLVYVINPAFCPALEIRP